MVLVLSTVVCAANAKTAETLEQRIAPVGAVCVEGTECAAAGKAVAVSSGPRSGADVFNTYCTACHGTGVMGAPKAGDKGAWNDRLAKGFDSALANAIKGLNLMPAKGTCADCSDEELSNAIKYMSK